jgi:hypothetical protein
MADQKTKTPKASSAPKPEGYTFGRPTKYLAEYCEKVVELGKLGKSLVQIASALDTTKQTLINWCDQNPDFLAAMEKSRAHSQSYWETIGHDGMMNKSIDASIWSRSMAARFPADWRESKHQEVTGSVKVDHAQTASNILETLASAKAKAEDAS